MRSYVLSGLMLALAGGGLLLPLEGAAQSVTATRAQAEASMMLTGTIDISPTGSVEAFRLRDEAKVEAYLRDFVQKQVAQWCFEPIMRDGVAVPARTPVSLRLVARSTPERGMEVELRSASFRNYDATASSEVVYDNMTPPRYPRDVFNRGGAGEVLLLIQVGRDGSVANIAAEQVNLYMVGLPKEMERVRDRLAKASIDAARRWSFRPPTTGEHVDEPSWTVRVPVTFRITHGGGVPDTYGRWQAYIPGPRQKPSWDVGSAADDASADALPEGGVYMAGVDKGPKLLTPLGG